MTLNRRLDKIERLLTPKQAVILWLQEIRQYRNGWEYVRFLATQPESAAPIYRITKQIDRNIRETMKGQPPQVVERAVRRAVRDVYFLINLHHQVNGYVATEERIWNLTFVALEGNLRAMMRENHYQHRLNNLSSIYSREMPYPLDTETADTINAAIRNHVTTWDQLEEDNTLVEWFDQCLLDRGEKEIPDGAFIFEDSKFKPNVTPENEKEVRALFKDDIEFERFKTGEDYTKLWATVKDADYTKHYDQMVSAIRELVDSGKIERGLSVCLETVPVPFLQFATIVEKEWLDRYVVVLAEVGAMLADKGYQQKETNDHHPLAWPSFIDESGKKIDQKEIIGLCLRADRHLKKFPGRIKEIDGRPYINFADYCAWRGRKGNADIESCVSDGFITNSWNEWVHAKKGKRDLAGVPVARLECYVQEHDYLLCSDGSGEQLKRRELLLNIAGKKETPKVEEGIAFWKDMAGTLTLNLHGFQQAVTTIRQRYFDGEEIMFSDSVKSLTDLEKYTEDLITEFNNRVAKEPEYKIIMETVRQVADKVVTGRVSGSLYFGCHTSLVAPKLVLGFLPASLL